MTGSQTPDRTAGRRALQRLALAGAHLVLCTESKRPIVSRWQKVPARLEAALDHDGLVGVIPASLGLVVVDIDQSLSGLARHAWSHPDIPKIGAGAARCALGEPLANIRTRSGGFHLVYRSEHGRQVGNAKWRYGDVRGSRGFIVLWDPTTFAAAVDARDGAAAVDVARLPKRCPPGYGPALVALTSEGGRSNALNEQAFLDSKNGRWSRELEAIYRLAGSVCGLTAKEVDDTLASAHRAGTAQPSGATETPVASARGNGHPVPQKRAEGAQGDAVAGPLVSIPGLTKAGLIQALEVVGVHLRHNVRAGTTEISNGAADWCRADDRSIDDLRETIRQRCEWTPPKGEPKPAVFGAETWRRCSNAVLHDHEVDPFLVRLQGLPPWDGKSRIDDVLAALWGRSDDEVGDTDTLRQWASRELWLGPVQRAFAPGCKLRAFCILAGEQGCGKSALLESMLWPRDAQEWFVSGLDLAADDKALTEAILGAVIVEAAEMVGAGRADLERIKAFITRGNDNHIRLAYRRDRESFPRRAIIVGTANPSAAGILPNDPTGLTRFVVIDLPAPRSLVGNIEDWISKRRDQLWAEAMHRYQAGERASLPDHLHNNAATAAEQHRRRDEFLEDSMASLALRPMTLGEIAQHIGLARDEDAAVTVSQRDQKRLGAALSAVGWRKRRQRQADGRRAYLWEPPV